MKKHILLLIMLLAGAFASQAQLAVKSNLLYDATTTPNLGLEFGVDQQQTINVTYGLNAWNFKRNGEKSMAKHWVVQPEWRWWFCSKFAGHFVGVHAMGGEFNAANAVLPIPGVFFGGENLTKQIHNMRCQGAFAGVGATYGYQYPLSKHWNLEAEVGVGYNHVWYSRYACGDCGGRLKKGTTNYAGLTKLGLSIMYLF